MAATKNISSVQTGKSVVGSAKPELSTIVSELSRSVTELSRSVTELSRSVSSIIAQPTISRRGCIIMLGVVAVLILIIFLVLVAIISYINFYQQPSKINPCDNFYKFACAWWFGGISSYSIMTGKQVDIVLHRIKDILENKTIAIQVTSAETFAKAVDMYETCVNRPTYEGTGTNKEYLLKVISNLGPWPILATSDSRNEYDLSHVAQVLGNVHRMGFTDILFEITVSKGFHNSNQIRFEIESRHERIGKKIYRYETENYYEKQEEFLLQCVEQIVTSDDFPDMKYAVKKIIDLKKEIIKGLESLPPFPERLMFKQEVDFDTFQMQSKLDWETIFKIMFQIDSIPGNIVIIYNKIYIDTVEDMLIINTKAALDLIIWEAIQQFIWHTNHMLANIDERYNPFTYNIQYNWQDHANVMAETYQYKKHIPNWERCLNAVVHCFPNTILDAYANYYISKSDRKRVAKFTSQIVESFISELKALKWLDVVIKDSFIEKASHMEIFFSYDTPVDDLIFLENTIFISKTFHLANVVKCQQIYTRFKLAYISNESINYFDSLFNVGVYYDQISNSLRILTVLAQPPYYNATEKGAVNFGTYGTLISQALIMAFQEQIYNAEEQEQNELNTNTKYKMMIECYIKQYNKYLPKNIKLGKFSIQEYIANEGSVRLSFRAYKKWLSKNKKKAKGLTKIVFSEFTSDQIFFLSYAMMYCAQMDDKVVKYLMKAYNKVYFSDFVNGPLKNMFEFNLAFGCGRNEMTRANPCEFF